MRRGIWLAFLLLPQLLWAGDANEEARQHMQAGLQAAQQHRLDEAITEFRKVTEIAPALPAGYVRLGQVYMEEAKFNLALAPLQRALELDPKLAAAHKLLGYALLAQGYAGEAIPHFQEVQDVAGLGIAQIETDRPGEAVTNLQAALAQTPDDPDLLFYLSRASEMLSTQSTELLLRGFPNSARAHQTSGKTFYNMRQMPEAEKEYRQAIAMNPELPGLHLELGQIYEASSQWPRAEEEFRQEAGRQPGNAEVAYRLGDVLLQQGKAKEAQLELQRADKLRPQMPETLYALGKAALQNGDNAAAERAWLRVAELEKDSALAGQAHFNLAGLYRKQRKTEQADKEMQAFRGSRKQGDSAAIPTDQAKGN